MLKISPLIKNGLTARTAEPEAWLDWRGNHHNRKRHVSASEIGSCARQIKFGKMLPSAGLKTNGFAERGNSVEAWAVEQLRYSGVGLIAVGEEQRTVWDGVQSGTPDGIIRTQNGDVLWECKSFDPRANTTKFPTKKHVWQVTQNIDLVNTCYDLDIDYGVITYINASNYFDILDFPVEFDVDLAKQLEDRAYWIHEAESPGDLPAEGMFTGECGNCAFTEQCSGAVEAAKRMNEKAKEQENVSKRLFR